MAYRVFCWACYWLVMAMPLWIGRRKNPLLWWALPYAGEWAYRPAPDKETRAMSESTHERLIRLQSDDELERKAMKAARKGLWTQEELDAADREAQRLCEWLGSAPPKED